MADFTVEGIIEVDASRGIRGVKQFRKELTGLHADLKKTGKEIDELDRKKVEIEVNADTAGIKQLKEDLKTLKDQQIDIEVDADTSKALVKISEFVKMLDGLKVTLDVDADTEQAMIAALKLKEQIDNMRATIKVDADKGVLGGGGGGSGGAGGLLGALGGSAMIGAIVALVSALGPLTAAVAALGAASLGGLSIMGVGFASLAAFAVPAVKDMASGIKLLNTDTSKLSPEKLEEFNKQLADFKKNKPGIYGLAKGFQELKSNYMEFADSLRPPLVRAAGHAIGFLNNLVKQTGPIAQAAAPAFADLVKSMKIGVAGKEWSAFFSYVKQEIPGFIKGFGEFMGNILTGVANLAVALDPVTKMVGKGFLGMSEDFRKWSQTLESNKGFQKFIDYMVEMGPKVWDTLVKLGRALGDMLINLAPIGERVLSLIGSFSEWYNTMSETHPEITEMATQAAALALVLGPLLGPVTSLIGPIGALAGAVGGTAVAIGAIIGLFAGLGTYLALTTDTGESFTEMWNSLREAWDKAKETGKEIWAALKEIWTWVEKSGAIEQYQQAFSTLADIFVKLLPVIKMVAILIGAQLVGAFIAFGFALNIVSKGLMAFVWLVETVVNAVIGFFKWLFDVLIGHSIIPDLINGIIAWFAKLPGRLASIVGQAASYVIGKFVSLKNSVTQRVVSLVSAGIAKFNEFKTRIMAVVSALPGAVSAKFQAMKAAALAKIQEFKTSAVDKFQSVLTRAREIFAKIKSAVTSGFANAGSWLTNAGRQIINGLMSGLNEKLDDVKEIADKIGGFLADRLPGSPVKEGPLKKLNNGYAGGEIIRMVIGGIDSERAALTTMMKFVASDIRDGFGDPAQSINGDAYSAMGPGYGVASTSGGNMTVYNEFNVPPNFDKREFGKLVDESLDLYYTTGGQKNV